MKKILTLLVALTFTFIAFTGCDNSKEYRFVTGGESGTYYAFGNVLAQHATNNADVKIKAVVGNGSKANVLELEDGTAQFAFCQSDVMAYAYSGSNLFESKITCFSTVAALYTEQVQIVTCDSSITTVADLKGKKVSVGASGSGVYFNAVDVLGAYGLAIVDKAADAKDDNYILATYQSFSDSADALKNEQIAAAFIVAGAPTSAITDLAATNANTHLVAIDADHITTLLQASPYYAQVTIPAGTYSSSAFTATTTVGVGAVILARDDVDEDVVYNFVKDIFDNASSLTANHAKYAEINLEYGASITSVPYHKGAAKYFNEKGKTVTTK